MRIGLVGLGDIAQKAYLPLICRHPAITPVLCTRDPQRLKQLSAQYRVGKSYTDYAALLQSAPDAVMIHASTESHYRLATAALERGIAVFVDKPLSYQLEECEGVIEFALARDLPLFCGFNRRYAPLYQEALATAPFNIHYQKNRHALPAAPRQFVYDDFIHVLDFVRHAGVAPGQNFHVLANQQKGLLANVQVSWQGAGAVFTAAMNRLCGRTFERLDYSGENQSWHIENLRQGIHCLGGKSHELNFGDWQDTLFKRGFVDMLEAFLLQVREGAANQDYLQGVLDSHRMCEQVLRALPK
ncbi:Gfo/Idh/MocA family protein [Gilvimarinus sp. DA14]|uniref:Gfo/Idh/MocA family protein n=1 Tax=Gilvimarinus sp. DA14 TaxID=2956798 RepID=UPI0020B81502|nr:Gfo/Idh/MocA family oxidoreductase [Gilvimarinus sp. DA14]UTF60079.1 Gfo/Idh/MocA family oxidoreductase [Gilvimarinus sp. DA14]